MNAAGIRCVVEGRVQGVFYRASTAERAQSLGLDGWVRNLHDGAVEVVAAGDAAGLDTLVAWLWEGPPASRVSGVAVEEWTQAIEPGFRILR